MVPSTERLRLIDSLIPDLVESIPSSEKRVVSIPERVELQFSMSLPVPETDTDSVFLSRYLALIYEDGTPGGSEIAAEFGFMDESKTRVSITPHSPFSANSRYRVDIRGVAGSPAGKRFV